MGCDMLGGVGCAGLIADEYCLIGGL